MAIPTSAKVIIVGGGVIGTSVAYHLAKSGWTDVLLLEQGSLAGGTSWHAAGLIGRLRTTNSMTRINKYSAELYASLEKETGHSVGWKQVGSLIVGKSKERMQQLQRTAAMSEWFGVQVDLISPEQALEKWPLLRIDDVLGAAWLPHDGKVIPKELAIALALGAKKYGATILENVRVQEVVQHHGQATGVRVADSRSEAADSHLIEADYVVLCGGMWTRELGLGCGVTIPLYPVEHHYVVSETISGAFDELPVGRDPDLCIYFRGEADAVMLGAFQAHSKAWMVDQVPKNFSYQLLEPDWEKFAEPLRHGKHRIPALETSGFAKFVNGPESFTPDNNFILGEAPELQRLFVAAGFNSVGIASAGGAGKYLAEWMIAGEPTLDLWSVDIRRFGPWANNRSFLRERVTEVLGLHYQMAWPNREFETGRGIRRSALHERLAFAGASFGVKGGWERPNWFAHSTVARQAGGFAVSPVMEYSFDRQNWFANHQAEHRACREAVAIFDQTGFAKFMVQGPDALALLQRVCGNNIDVAPGKTVYTGLFNERGGFESDLTVLRLSAQEFYLITGTAQAVRDRHWILRHRQAGEQVELVDVTAAYGVLGVMGPHSRKLLEQLTDADLSNEAFPFGTARNISLGSATVRAVRITYVGELGWELHVPSEQMVPVYQTLIEHGHEFGLTNAGHYAINSLRLEKGYRAWGAELSPDDTPLEAGLSFALDWQKEFIGRDALLRQKETGWKRQLAIFVLEDPGPMLWGSEPIYRDGAAVGYTASGSYGHSVGGAVAMGYVNHTEIISRDFLLAGHYQINVTGRKVPAKIFLQSPYDPKRLRIMA